jgi:hypothetical protein
MVNSLLMTPRQQYLAKTVMQCWRRLLAEPQVLLTVH